MMGSSGVVKKADESLVSTVNGATAAASGATLLAIVVSEFNAFFGNAVNARSSIAHHATIIVADVLDTDIIAPEYKDIGFFSICSMRDATDRQQYCENNSAALTQKFQIHVIVPQIILLKFRRSDV